MQGQDSKKYLSLKEAAYLSGYHADYIGYLIRKGKLRARKAYGSSAWLVYKEDLLGYKARKQRRIEEKARREQAQKSKSLIKIRAKKDLLGYKARKQRRIEEKARREQAQKSKSLIKIRVSDILPPKRKEKIRKITKEDILGIRAYQSKKSQYFNIGYRVFIAIGILFIIFSTLTGFSFKAFGEKKFKTELYSSNCKGTWKNPQNTQGKPDVFSDGTIDSFAEGNSSVYEGGLGDLMCREFNEIDTGQKSETETKVKNLQSAKVYFSFALHDKGVEELLFKRGNQKAERTVPFWQRFFSFIVKAQEPQATSTTPGEPDKNNLDNKIIIWYSTNGETWYVLDKISSLPLSNSLNGGYFNYEAPFLKSWEDIENLKIKFEGVVGGETNIVAFLDSAWIEADYIEIKKVETKTISLKRHFKGYEDLEFKLEELLEEELEEKGFFSRLFWRPKITKVIVFNYLKEKIDIPIEIEGSKIKLLKPKDFSPGLYKLKIEYTENGELKTLEQDFTWGVLAINPDKAIYKAGETSLISIGVLNDKGQIVCDAEVTLTITDPANKKRIKSTKDESIVVSDTCRIKDVFTKPDYSTIYSTGIPGTYTLTLTATHENGTYTITDAFEVESSPSFTIKRTGPTRVFPIKYQPMELEITAYENFKGEIIERLPEGFQVKPEKNGVTHLTKSGIEIVWQKSIKRGETISLSYTFKAPEEAPAFYLAGPAKIGDWQEPRQWQLAIDQVYMYLFWDDFVGGAPTGWSLVTTYDGRFPRGDPTSVTFGTTGGNANHTPTVSGSVTQNDIVIDEIGAGAGSVTAAVTHTHSSLTCTPVADDNLPAYRSLGLIKSDSADPSTIPQGAIALFDANPDANWTKQSAQDSNMIRVNNSVATGGSDSHQHTLQWSLGAAAEETARGGTVARAADDLHTHSFTDTQTASDPGNSLPPYIQVIVAKANSSVSVPTDMIAMFDGDPGSNWSVLSNSGGAFYQQFVQGSATYNGTSQGATTHSHASETSGEGTVVGTNKGDDPGTGTAGSGHTHTLSASFLANENHVPEYFSVVYAKKLALAGITISGTVYDDDVGSNPVGDGTKVSVAINNTKDTNSDTTTSGAFSFTTAGTVNSGDTLTLFLDTNGGIVGSLVTVSDGNDLTSIEFYQNHVVVRYETGTDISILDMTKYDTNEDSDVNFTAEDLATDTLNVEDGSEFFIPSTYNFDADGNLESGAVGIDDMEIQGTYTAGTSESIRVSGTWINSGTFAESTSTVTFDATTSEQITSGGANGDFNNVVLNGSGGQWTLQDAMIVNGDLTTTDGTLAGTQSLTVNGGAITGTNGSTNLTGGTATLSGTGDLGPTGSGTYTFSSLTLSGTTTAAGNFTVASVLTISDSLDASNKTITLSGSGDPLVVSGTFTANSSTVEYTSGSGANVTSLTGANAYNILTIAGTGTFNATAGTLTTNSNLNVTSGTFNLDTSDPVTTISGNVNIGASGTLTASAIETFNVAGSFSNSNVFNHQNGTVTFTDTTGNKTIDLGSSSFNNVIFNGSGGGWSFTTSAATITNDLTMTTGTLDNSNGTVNITVNGGVIGTAGVINMTDSSHIFKQRVGAAENFGPTTSNTDWTFRNLTFSNSTATAYTITTQSCSDCDVTVTSGLTIGESGDSATTTLAAGDKIWTLSGSGTPLVFNASSILQGNTSTFKYTGSGTTTTTAVNGGSGYYYNLQIYPGNVATIHRLGTGTFDINGDLILGNGAYVNTMIEAATNNPTINLAGDLTLCGSPCNNDLLFFKGTGTLTFDGSGTKTWTDNNSIKQDIGAVAINGTNMTVNLGSSVKATSAIIASNQTLALQSSGYVLTLTGSGTAGSRPFIVSGTLSEGTNSTVKFTGNGNSEIEAETYYNLELVPSPETFGYEIKGTSNTPISADEIRGSYFTAPLTGTVGSITVYLEQSASNTPYLQCAIYKYSDDSLVGSTEEWQLTSGFDNWHTFDITSGGSVNAETTYFLVVWADAPVTGYYVWQSAKSGSQSYTYNSWPNPWDPSLGSQRLSIYATYEAADPTYTLGTAASQSITTTGYLTIGDATNQVTVNSDTYDPDITVYGDLTLMSSGLYTAGSGTLILDGTPSDNYFDDQNGTKQNMGTVQIGQSPGVTNLKSDMTADSLTVDAADTFNTNGWDLNIATFVTVNGIMDCTDAGAGIDEGDGTDINLGTNWTVAGSGTFTAQESDTYPTEVIFDENTASSVASGGTDESHDFWKFTVTKSAAATATLSADIHVEDDLTISNANSTLDVSGTDYDITIGGDFTNSGTFTYQQGTVTFDDSGQSSTLSYSAATTFYDLTISTAGKQMYFDDAYRTNINGTWTVQGTDCTTGRVFLDSETTNDWEVDATGTINIDYADIEDSTAITSISSGVDNSTEDNNDNTNWTINAGACGGTLTFTIGTVGAGSCTGDTGAPTVNATSAADAVDFGILAADAFEVACHELTVDTNATDGYILTVQETTNMLYGTDTLDDTTCDGGACTEVLQDDWATASANQGLGHGCTNTTGTDCDTVYTTPAGACGAAPCYRQFACVGSDANCDPDTGGETAQTLMSNSGAVSSNQSKIHYKISRSSSQPAGAYQNVIVFIVTPTY